MTPSLSKNYVKDSFVTELQVTGGIDGRIVECGWDSVAWFLFSFSHSSRSLGNLQSVTTFIESCHFFTTDSTRFFEFADFIYSSAS